MKLLRRFPLDMQPIIMAGYWSQPSRRESNLYLSRSVNQLSKAIGAEITKDLFDSCPVTLQERAKRYSDFCLNMWRYSDQQDKHKLTSEITRYAKSKGVKARRGKNVDGFILRSWSAEWWLRKLKSAVRQHREHFYLMFNRINRRKGIYCSDWQANYFRQFQQQQSAFLEQTVLVNELDQRYSLKELSALNVSNPKIRKTELMVRARGFEDYADELGHEGLFLTLTCPSRFHRAFSKSGHSNPKWDSKTPADGQKYLRQVWSRIRAAWHRQQIAPYGFRIAEPQHDGTPHWHLLLFAPETQHKALIATMRHYALQMDGDEEGAAQHRLDVKLVDKEKGCATGYIAKYVSKNVDGSDLDSGVYGEDPIEAAERVRAWASCWHIRQFQQIGGASVTVWRELRRLKAYMVVKGSQLAHAWQAADNGDWAAYLKAMAGISPKGEQSAKGGHCVDCQSAESPLAGKPALTPLYEVQVHPETGEAKTNRFDGTLTYALKGLLFQGQKLITRYHEWRRINAPVADAVSLGVL